MRKSSIEKPDGDITVSDMEMLYSPIMQLASLTEFTAFEALDKRIIDRGLLESLEGKGVLVEYHK